VVTLSFQIGSFKVLQQRTKGMFNDFKEDFKQEQEQIKEEMLKQYRVRSEQQLDEIMQKERAVLQELIDKQFAYQRAKVLVMGSEQQLKELENRELIPLDNREEALDIRVYSKHELQKQLSKKDVLDLFIYVHNPIDGDNDPNVIAIAELFEQANKNIPLIIYAPRGTIQEKVRAVEIYPWIGIANLPTTLVEQSFILITTFSNQKK
jgi:hypothetical protein